MTKGLPYIIDTLFGKTELKDVSLEELHELVREFPSFNTAHFLLSRKLILQNVDSAETEINRTALYFNNAYWLRTLLDEDRQEADHPAPANFQVDTVDTALPDAIIPEEVREEVLEEVREEVVPVDEMELTSAPAEPEEVHIEDTTDKVPEIREISSADTEPAPEQVTSSDAGESENITSFDELLRKYKMEETPLPPSPDIEEKIFSQEEPPAGQHVPEQGKVTEHNSGEEAPADTREIINEYGVFEEDEKTAVSDEDVLEGLEFEDNQTPVIENIETPVIENIETPVIENIETPVIENIETPVIEIVATEPVRIPVEHDFEAFDRPIGRSGDRPAEEGDEITSEEQEAEYNPQHLVNAEEEESIDEPPVEHRAEEVVTEFQEASLFDRKSVEIAEEYHAMASSSDTGLQEELSGHDADSISEHKADEIVFEPAASWAPGNTMEENNDTRPLPHFDTAKAGAIVYTPYHMVDYFASQGIKLVLDENPPDQLGRQLKSFTDWLKVLKKSPVQASIEKPDDREVEKIRHFAAHSLEERDILTESMAEVLAKQGMYENAIALYQKLSLIYPPKSAYFASRIEQLKASLP